PASVHDRGTRSGSPPTRPRRHTAGFDALSLMPYGRGIRRSAAEWGLGLSLRTGEEPNRRPGMLRLNFLMAALLAVALTACPSRDDDQNPDGGDTCVGECPDAGDNGDGGGHGDGGDTNPEAVAREESHREYDAERTFTDDTCTPFESEYEKPDCRSFHWDGVVKLMEGVEQVRYGECRHQFLRLENVQVVGIDEAYFERTDGEADPTKPRRNFWVVDAENPTMGIWVHFRFSDSWIDATGEEHEREIVLGDIINIEAKLDQQPGYNDRDGRRWMLTNLFQNGNV